MSRVWTNHEILTLREMALLGKSARQISLEIGRSIFSVRWKARDLQIDITDFRGKDDEAVTDPDKDARLGSQILREACLDLFQRTANRYYISLNDAMACHLGFHAPPRFASAPYKTASAMRRLAAA